MKTKKRGLHRFLLILAFALLILALAFLALASPTDSREADESASRANEGQWESVSSSDWMADIDGSLQLSRISIPGSHDSCTQYVVLPLIGRCQDASIAQQLSDGVRVLDIRLDASTEADGDIALTLSHGPLECKAAPHLGSDALSFGEVLSQCRKFLSDHPTETIVLLVKHEHGSADAQQIQDALLKCFGSTDDLYTESGDPTLDEVRGKMVLLRRYGQAGDGLSGAFAGWEDQGGSQPAAQACESMDIGNGATLFVQDRYEYDAADKWAAFTDCLDRSPAGENALLLNYLSTKGSGSVGIPKKFAAQLNSEFIENDLLSGADYGCVMFDFVTEGLARHVFASNSFAAAK